MVTLQDNRQPFIDPLEIEEARRTLDSRTLRRNMKSFDIGESPVLFFYSRVKSLRV